MDDKNINIIFPIKHSDDINENLNNTIILKLRALLNNEAESYNCNCSEHIRMCNDYNNRLVTELQNLIEQKRIINYEC